MVTRATGSPRRQALSKPRIRRSTAARSPCRSGSSPKLCGTPSCSPGREGPVLDERPGSRSASPHISTRRPHPDRLRNRAPTEPPSNPAASPARRPARRTSPSELGACSERSRDARASAGNAPPEVEDLAAFGAAEAEPDLAGLHRAPNREIDPRSAPPVERGFAGDAVPARSPALPSESEAAGTASETTTAAAASRTAGRLGFTPMSALRASPRVVTRRLLRPAPRAPPGSPWAA